MPRLPVLAAFLVTTSLPHALRAQCPDGTPPPCAGAAPRRPARPPVTPPPEANRARLIMILPFRNLAHATSHDWLVEASTALLANALRNAPQLTIAPDERVYPALRRQGLEPGQIMDAALVRRAAEETGGWTAIYGEVLALPTRVLLSARATDVVTGSQVGYAVVELLPSDDIRLGFDSLAERLLGSLGLRPGQAPVIIGPAAALNSPGARP